MKITNARITILVGSDKTTIELIDMDANITFVKVELTPKQLSEALSRIAHTECDINVFGLDNIGKTMVNKRHEFEIPTGIRFGNADFKETLSELIKETLPDGWISDNYFNSQDTFFKRDGKEYAQTTIRQWI